LAPTEASGSQSVVLTDALHWTGSALIIYLAMGHQKPQKMKSMASDIDGAIRCRHLVCFTVKKQTIHFSEYIAAN
jgi:hypothetical protein